MSYVLCPTSCMLISMIKIQFWYKDANDRENNTLLYIIKIGCSTSFDTQVTRFEGI